MRLLVRTLPRTDADKVGPLEIDEPDRAPRREPDMSRFDVPMDDPYAMERGVNFTHSVPGVGERDDQQSLV